MKQRIDIFSPCCGRQFALYVEDGRPGENPPVMEPLIEKKLIGRPRKNAEPKILRKMKTKPVEVPMPKKQKKMGATAQVGLTAAVYNLMVSSDKALTTSEVTSITKFKSANVSSILYQLKNRGKLVRTLNDDGSWEYALNRNGVPPPQDEQLVLNTE